MIKTNFFLYFFSFITTIFQAQDNNKFGVKLGSNFLLLAKDNTASTILGLNLGVFVDCKISDRFSMQPEIMINRLGSKETITENFSDPLIYSSERNKLVLNYINLSFMTKFYLFKKINLSFGPQIGYLFGAEQITKKSYLALGESTSDGVGIDVKYRFDNIAFSLNTGIGYQITKNIGVDLRYSLGISDIEIEDAQLQYAKTNFYNRFDVDYSSEFKPLAFVKNNKFISLDLSYTF